MGSVAVISSLLESLPPRPPTPPRDIRHEPLLQQNQASKSISSRLTRNLHTPPSLYSAESSDASNLTSSRVRKKVGFLSQAEYKDPPVYIDGAAKSCNPTPVSLPSSSSRPVKSILKSISRSPNPLEHNSENSLDSNANGSVSLATMLESTIQQLAGADRDSKVDAYMMLVKALRASNNLPDRAALQEKMGLFMQFMQRDVVARTPENAIDSSLVNHALNLLLTFLHFPSMASTLSNDFGVFIIDHCIRSFEDTSVPKDVVRRLMQVIATQGFSSKVMTSDRIARLVASLHRIEEHLRGKSIIMSRILIYRKLVKQVKHFMVVHSDWLLDLFNDMLSSFKEIRSSAITLGLEAAFSIAKEKPLSRRVMEILSITHKERKYVEYYEGRLRALAKDKQESISVPQIWSVIILLLRCPLDKWEHFTSWLQIIQSCFNSGDFQTRIEANYAWSRLIYVFHLDERALSKRLSMLILPLGSQLHRKGTGKQAEDLRKTVVGVVCSLFYYTFRPNTNPTLLDSHWDNSLDPLLKHLIDCEGDHAQEYLTQACAILTGLFDSTPRLWKDDHIMDSPVAKPEELPGIDPKWIRRSSSRIFVVVEQVFEKKFLELADNNSPARKLWNTLVRTVATAASKEIKVSVDTAIFVACALNVLKRLWKRGALPSEDPTGSAQEFLAAMRAFLEVMIKGLGLLPFTEKLLVTDEHHNFVPMSTPSHRTGKSHGVEKSPVHHLFAVLSTRPPHVIDNDDFASFLCSVFTPFLAQRVGKARMDLALDLTSSLPMDALCPFGPWLLVSESVVPWLESDHDSHQSASSGNDTPLGQRYREVVKILERGIRSTPNLPWQNWRYLFSALCARARVESGEAGLAIVVIEPLAKVSLDQILSRPSSEVSDHTIKCVTELLSVATQPRDRQAVDAARRRLWGTVLAGSRSASFDTFDNLYKAANAALKYLYDEPDAAASTAPAELLKQLGSFLDRCNQELITKTLVALQDGLVYWIHDTRRLLRAQSSNLLSTVKALWDKISNLLAGTEHLERQLDALEPLLVAGFSSFHRSIVNTTASLWNKTFENTSNIQYPAKLKAILVSLQPHADIIMPGLKAPNLEHGGKLPAFVDSQEVDLIQSDIFTKSSLRPSSRASSAPRTLDSPTPAKPAKGKRQLEDTPEAKPSKAQRRHLTPKFRHDDSQVQFAAIDSSPMDRRQIESQLLTERQKEIRDRQKENSALFPHIRPSPIPQVEKAASNVQPQQQSVFETSLPLQRASTPKPEGTFDDYVTSTPTPRRGQLPVVSEHDPSDPPSSPPEPRRNPLAAEIRSRSASNSLLDEWQFSSSPISGSPIPVRQRYEPEGAAQNGTMDEFSLPEVEEPEPVFEETLPVENPTAELTASTPHGNEEEDVIENTAHESNLPELPSEEVPVTPRRHLRSMQHMESPRSDNEMFVDAPTSLTPPTPKRSERIAKRAQLSPNAKSAVPENASFVLSDIDETSLLRFVVELDSGVLDRSKYRAPTESPQQKRDAPGDLDCIVVGESPDSKRPHRRGSSRKAKSSTASPSVSSSLVEEAVTSSPASGREGRRKRKRSSSKAQDASDGRRKQPKSEVEAEEGIPDSQNARADEGSRVIEAGQVPEIPSSSVEYSSRSSPLEAVLPTAIEKSGHNVNKDVDEPTSDDQEHLVQSQIALESESHSTRSTSGGVASGGLTDPGPVKSAETTSETEIPAKDVFQPSSEGGAVEGEAGLSQEAVQPAQMGGMQKIMDALNCGFEELRSAKLSREEVYKLEDMFMDMKRELYEAERRGRSL